MYALKTGTRENDVFSRACELFKVNVNVHTIAMQLLVNNECTKPILALRRNSLDCLAIKRMGTCTFVHIHNCKKNQARSCFSRVFRHIST